MVNKQGLDPDGSATEQAGAGDDYTVLVATDFGQKDFLDFWCRMLEEQGFKACLAGPETDLTRVRYAVSYNPPPGLLPACPNLRVVQCMGAGVTEAMLQPDVCPPNVPIIRIIDPRVALRIATFCTWALINWQRKCDDYARAERASHWDKSIENFMIRDNETVRVGLLGMGKMGEATARLLVAAGYPVAGWTRTPRSDALISGVRYFNGDAGLLDMAAVCDVLICLLPLTPATRGVLSAPVFDAMPPDGLVINVGRGEHVVDADLLHALDSGHLSAAVLDVFEQEPLPPDSPFWSHPKVKVFPHVAATLNATQGVLQMRDNLRALDAGKSLDPDRYIDRSRGY